MPENRLRQSAERCMGAMSRVAKRLGAKCVLFGSWAQDAPLEGSDLDVALVFPGQFEAESPLGKSERVQILRSFVARAEFETLDVIEEIFRAKVPILRLEYADESLAAPLEVDLSVGNSRTGMLDEWIHNQLKACSRCKPFLRLVKHWAKQRNINKALLGCLNSISWTMLVLFFVQDFVGDIVVRNLFMAFLEFVAGFGETPDTSVKLSMQQGRWVSRQLSIDDKHAVLCIEDPTLPSNNTARSLTISGWTAILEEVLRAQAAYKAGQSLMLMCTEGPSRMELAPPHLQAELLGRPRPKRPRMDGLEVSEPKRVRI